MIILKLGWLSLLLILIACVKTDQIEEQEDSHIFRYDFLSGNCINGNGEIGYNDFVLEDIKGTKNAECMDLSNLELIYLEEGITEENKSAYNELKNWNFRGSLLNDAELFFNDIVDADLRGAKFSKLQFGYSTIIGKIDEFAEVPDGCGQLGDSIGCSR